MSTDLPGQPGQSGDPSELAAVDLAGPDDEAVAGLPGGPAPRWRHQALAIGLVVLLLGGVAVALLASNQGEPSAEAALAEVRAFVAEQRSATFTGVSEDVTAPMDGDVGTSETTRSRLKGELRLPDQLHIVTDDGDWADETIVHGRDVYNRSADSAGELAAEQWVKSTTEEEAVSFPFAPGAAMEYMPGLEDAAGFMTMAAAGAPLDLTTLFDRLAKPERLGPNRIRASATIGELLPDDFREAMEKAAEEPEPEPADVEDEGLDGVEEDELDFEPGELFEEVLEVTIDYGPDGRLDVLSFDTEDDTDDELYRSHQEFRFSGWGSPITLTLPTGDQIDPTPTIDERGLAAAAAAGVTVLAPAPSALPPGWGLASVDAEEADAEFETCAGADLSFLPADSSFDGADDDVGPISALSVRSIRADCTWADDGVVWPGRGGPAHTVQIGRWTAQVYVEDDDEPFGFGTMVVFDADATKVVVTTTLPEAQFIDILKTLQPFDLGAYKIVEAEYPY